MQNKHRHWRQRSRLREVFISRTMKMIGHELSKPSYSPDYLRALEYPGNRQHQETSQTARELNVPQREVTRPAPREISPETQAKLLHQAKIAREMDNFKQEIVRRYQQSIVNKVYRYPRLRHAEFDGSLALDQDVSRHFPNLSYRITK